MEPNQNQTTESTTQTVTPAIENTNTTKATPEIKDDMLMGILCYIGPLVIIPYMTTLDNSFVKYHVKQGIVLFGFEIVIYIIGSMFLFSGFYPIIVLLNLGTLILSIIGIVNVIGKKETPLPLIGQLADKVKI